MKPDGPGFEALVVCTGNLNRSPMAAALLADQLAQRGVDALVRSAGFVTHDQPAQPHAVALLAERGLDLSGHRSQRVRPSLLRSPDLVLCMERRHVRDVAVMSRRAFERTFTLPELARRATEAGPRPTGVEVREWLRRVGDGRAPADLLAPGDEDDVTDPHRQDLDAYRAALATIDELVTEVVDHLFPDR